MRQAFRLQKICPEKPHLATVALATSAYRKLTNLIETIPPIVWHNTSRRFEDQFPQLEAQQPLRRMT
jgi:hypothetical protein